MVGSFSRENPRTSPLRIRFRFFLKICTSWTPFHTVPVSGGRRKALNSILSARRTPFSLGIVDSVIFHASMLAPCRGESSNIRRSSYELLDLMRSEVDTFPRRKAKVMWNDCHHLPWSSTSRTSLHWGGDWSCKSAEAIHACRFEVRRRRHREKVPFPPFGVEIYIFVYEAQGVGPGTPSCRTDKADSCLTEIYPSLTVDVIAGGNPNLCMLRRTFRRNNILSVHTRVPDTHTHISFINKEFCRNKELKCVNAQTGTTRWNITANTFTPQTSYYLYN